MEQLEFNLPFRRLMGFGIGNAAWDQEPGPPSRRRCRSQTPGRRAGPPECDPVLMFKVFVLQTLYTRSDDATEFQIRDRLSFMRFLGLRFEDAVPDAKTVWLFREHLTRAGAIEARHRGGVRSIPTRRYSRIAVQITCKSGSSSCPVDHRQARRG